MAALGLAAFLDVGSAAHAGGAEGSADPEPAGAALDASSSPLAPQQGSVPYVIVYVRAPRFGDEENSNWPEVKHPFEADAGADLVLLHPEGDEEVLVEGGRGAVTDPVVSFDGKWIYFAKFEQLPERGSRGSRPAGGADIYRIHVETRAIERLTHGERTPNRPGDRIPASVLNLGPCPLPGGRIAFTSNRNGFVPTKPFSTPTMQLFVMDEDGANVEPIAPMTLGSALHPTILRDGRLMFSSYESQGLRDRRLWALWAILPDGRRWEPLVSAFHLPQAFHFQTQLSSGDIVVIDYYNQNNNGFGAAFRFPATRPVPAFHSASERPPIRQTFGQKGPGGATRPFSFPYVPIGYQAVTPFTHPFDHSASCPAGAPCADKDRMGKVTHPSGAPGGDLLIVWTPGPATNMRIPTEFPRYDGGIYLIRDGGPAEHPGEIVRIKNDPGYNEAWPRAVVPYREIYGVDEPVRTAWLPNTGAVHPALPRGTPFGLVGSSSVYKRESRPGSGDRAYHGLDPFNTTVNEASSNWQWQGADVGRYADSDVWAVRIVALEPNLDSPHHGSDLFTNHANERHRILGEIPLRKRDAAGEPILDSEGNPDTSFLVKIPADTPFTFQTIDRNGMMLNMAQTWHQVRPGEMRADCGGCHAHSQAPLPFEGTAAARADYPIYDLSKVTPLLVAADSGDPTLEMRPGAAVDVEFLRDIRPVLQRNCVGCHGGERPAGDLRLDDTKLVGNLPADYLRLANDPKGEWGRSSLLKLGWRYPNASRYVRMFQSRRSLLVWKIFGARLDGWSNEDHPTESVPGDASTLPQGAKPNDADLDYSGVPCPPPGSHAPPLTSEQKMMFARWIDLGAPIDAGRSGRGDRGWFSDEIRPALTVTSPRPGSNPAPLDEILIGAVDANSGLDEASLSLEADFAIGRRRAGLELRSALVPVGDGVWRLRLETPLASLERGRLIASVRDRQGNLTRIERTFSVE